MMSREIDALVAEHVMGFAYRVDEAGRSFFWCPKTKVGMATIDIYDSKHFLPHYSTDIAAAWEVVEKVNLFDSWAMWQPNTDGSYEIFGAIRGAEFVIVRAETAPMAICIAALKAKGVEVEQLLKVFV